MNAKHCQDSFVVKTSIVLPPDTNSHGTLFGGKLMAYIDDVAALSATRHARRAVVTASTDSVDFLNPIYEGSSVCLESFVTYAGRTSMEVFVRVISEDLLSGERSLCALSFLTLVAIGEDGKPTEVPKVIPQTKEESELYESAPKRAAIRRERRQDSENLARKFGTDYPWCRNQ